VKYWLHCAHLVVEGKKMSKSLGNFFTLRDLLEKGIDPMAIRWVLIATHYRQPNNFSFDAVDAAKESIRRIQDFRTRLGEVQGQDGDTLEAECAACERDFAEAMDDDLNISGALAAVFDLIREVNRKIDGGGVSETGTRQVLTLLDRLDSVTGLFGGQAAGETPQDILDLVLARQEARRAKDFARADALRDQLAAAGWILEDTPDGPRVKRG
jgi:cysteinyl-tRNA synthetase